MNLLRNNDLISKSRLNFIIIDVHSVSAVFFFLPPTSVKCLDWLLDSLRNFLCWKSDRLEFYSDRSYATHFKFNSSKTAHCWTNHSRIIGIRIIINDCYECKLSRENFVNWNENHVERKVRAFLRTMWMNAMVGSWRFVSGGEWIDLYNKCGMPNVCNDRY